MGNFYTLFKLICSSALSEDTMFAQDYDLGDEGSDIEPERVHDDDSDR